MPMVFAVSFQRYGRLYYLDPGELTPKVGDKVLYPTTDGAEVAECVWGAQWVSDDMPGLAVCAGPATRADLDRDEAARRTRAEAKVVSKRLIRAAGLPMKVVGVDFTESRPGIDRLITLYFSAPGRVDFRDLVRDLARALGARIDLRQLSARDEAKVTGGIGPCGRDLCCATFLRDFEPVTLKMAKDQDLPLNPMAISGACGKLMCCLKYEHPLYAEFAADAPAPGVTVTTPEGDGVVVGHDVPREKVVVRLSESGRRCSCSRADVCAPRAAHDTRHPDGADPDGADPAGTSAPAQDQSPITPTTGTVQL